MNEDMALGPNEMDPARRAAYDAVNELLREDPAARPWRLVAVALGAALPIARKSGREDAARALEDAQAFPYILVERAATLARGLQSQETATAATDRSAP